MLILTRRIGQAIVISDNISVQVVAIERGHVKLGIDAPRQISVRREELAARKQAQP